MTALEWDKVGEKLYETGTDRGVLYPMDDNGTYDDGVAWNGLTSVTQQPTGGEVTKQYADNQVYVALRSLEEFEAAVEAFMYPDEFEECEGSRELAPGVTIGQQARRSFGFSYRTLVGNDVVGNDFGYKIHLVYGASASPSEKAHNTVNDSPELAAFNWTFTTTPVTVTGFKPTAHLEIDSTEVDPADLAALEAIIYGDESNAPRLPLPDEVASLFTGGTVVNLALDANKPTYNAGTHVITLPAVTGVQWLIDGEEVANGAQPALGVGETVEVTAAPEDGYVLDGDTDFTYTY